ncbi:hypothetical protein [Zavarzinella formosa]|uniref:hypothetical protein n=1 Tax=Zavarzinella formosa TaxID=360055 RepID=UPI0003192E57|nr:hypothetical protein [Zavarzinella formosa]
MDPELRRSLYWIMLLAAIGLMVGRIANAELLLEPSMYKVNPTRVWPKERPEPFPTFSSNDRSRWATVRSLVEEGTFVIGKRIPDESNSKGYRDEGILFTDGFKSVDVVLHPDRQEFFSTKPPLLTVMAAGEYWLMHKYLKWNIAEHRWEVVVLTLVTLNVLPLAVGLWLLSLLLEAYGRTDWGRLFVFAVACFGTFLTTFSVTLNNHVPAACCVFYAMYLIVKPRAEGQPVSLLAGLGAGLFAGMAVCLDLPAAALAGALAAVLMFQSPKTLLTYLPAAILPMALQTWVNHEAIGTWEPIYAKFGGIWYEYPGSHWAKRHLPDQPQYPGIDFADEPKTIYTFHLLFGHHGLFSLTPVWLLALVGLSLKGNDAGASRSVRHWSLAVLAVVIGFYIWKSNNYGGWTSGPRWFFWITPLLLWGLLPAADSLAGSRLGRGFALLCFGAGVFAAVFPWTNPWRHPWIFQWGEYMGWFRY